MVSLNKDYIPPPLCALFHFRSSRSQSQVLCGKQGEMKEAPIFPMAKEADLCSDHGFDSEMECLQVAEEARRNKKRAGARPLDLLRCKLKKPISKDDERAKKRRRGWWKSALLFWNRARVCDSSNERHQAQRRTDARWSAASPGPIYATESGGGMGRRARRPSAGLLLAAAEFSDEAVAGTPYVSLRNLGPGDGPRAAPPMPIYLVT